MRLLFVHEVNYLRKVVYETQEYAERLAARGHEVVYIDFPEGEPRRGLRRLLDLQTEVRRGVGRAGVPGTIELRTPGRVLPPPADRLAASLTHVPAVGRALARERFDAVVLYAVPTNGWQTVILARRRRVPVLFRAIDVPTEMRRTAFRPLVALAAGFVYRHADAISTHTQPLRQYCIRRGAAPEKVSVEVPGFNLEHFAPGDPDPVLLDRYAIEPGGKVIVFMGEFHYFSAVEWLVEALAPYLRSQQDVYLLLLGGKPAVGGTSPERVRALAGALGVARAVRAVGRVEYADLPAHLRLADVAVVPLRRTVQADTALPSKALQYLACGLPTVSTPLAGLRSVVCDESMGIVYRELGEGFVAAVVELLGDAARRRQFAGAARGAATRLFDWRRCEEQFEAAIVRVIAASRERALPALSRR